jgi:hypothetical protein
VAAVALAHQLAQQELTAANVAQRERETGVSRNTNVTYGSIETAVSRNTNVTYGSIASNPADPAAGASSAALPSAGGGGGGGGGSGAGAAVAVAQGADEASAECKSALQTAECKSALQTLLQRTLMSEETLSSAKASSIENKEPLAKKPRIIEAAPSSCLTSILLENEQLPLKQPRMIEAAGAGAGAGAGGGHASSSTAEKPTCIARPCEGKAAAAGGNAGGMKKKVEEKMEEKMEKGGLGGSAQCSNGCEGEDNGVVRWCVPCKRYDNMIYYAMYIMIIIINTMIIIISRPVQAVRPSLSLCWKDVE